MQRKLVKLDTRPRREDFSVRELTPIVWAVAAGLLAHNKNDLGAVARVLAVTRAFFAGEKDRASSELDKPMRRLTDREVASHVGAVIGGCMGVADARTVRRAVQWWAQQPAEFYERMKNDALAVQQRPN